MRVESTVAYITIYPDRRIFISHHIDILQLFVFHPKTYLTPVVAEFKLDLYLPTVISKSSYK